MHNISIVSYYRGFTETMKSLRPEKKWTTKLSSAGLIYCHFGSEIIKLLMSNISDEVLNVIYDMVCMHLHYAVSVQLCIQLLALQNCGVKCVANYMLRFMLLHGVAIAFLERPVFFS